MAWTVCRMLGGVGPEQIDADKGCTLTLYPEKIGVPENFGEN